MKVLVLGAGGQLGRCLLDKLASTDFDVVPYGSDDLDVGDLAVTAKVISDNAPDVVINSSAYTLVDAAEANWQKAEHINSAAVANIASACAADDILLIHISTDYVFDGEAEEPYNELDNANPQSVYGKTKHLGELAVRSSGGQYVIIRTSWVFSEYGNNFLKTMVHLGSKLEHLEIVGDQFGCPTYAGDLANVIIGILPKVLAVPEFSGVYHYCGDVPCSWFIFAKHIFDKAKELGFPTPLTLKEVTTEQFPTPVKRPKYSVMDNSKIMRSFGVSSSNWRAAIKPTLKKLRNVNGLKF